MELMGRVYSLFITLVILIALFTYFNLKKDETRDLRCPKCNFLVDVEDIVRYGNIRPDCRTDWRVHPLKKE
jgi:hypothetical protein